MAALDSHFRRRRIRFDLETHNVQYHRSPRRIATERQDSVLGLWQEADVTPPSVTDSIEGLVGTVDSNNDDKLCTAGSCGMTRAITTKKILDTEESAADITP
jgi:hypothetical protein